MSAKWHISSVLLFLLLSLNCSAQEDCKNKYQILDGNNCLDCKTKYKDFPLAKTLLQSYSLQENQEKMQEILEMSESLESLGYIVWGRDTLHLNLRDEVDRAMKKLNGFEPADYMDGTGTNGHFRKMRAFELAIKEAMEVLDYYCSIIRTSKKQGFNNATDGVCGNGNELNRLLDQADDMMHRILELYKNGQKDINIDCCNPNKEAINFHLQTINELNSLLNSLQKYLDHLFLLHETNLSSVAWFATQYNEFTGSVSADLEKLKELSFAGVISDALVDNGLISQDDLDKISQMIQEYEDVQSLKNAIRNTFGDDVAEVFGVLFGDFTIKDLRENFTELVKNNPAKFKSLLKAVKAMPKSPKMGKVFDAISIAETSVQLFMHLLVSLDASGRIAYAQDRWWLHTEWFYTNTLISVLNNSIALSTYEHLLNTLNSLMAGKQILCLEGPEPKSKGEALELINSRLGLQLNAGTFAFGRMEFRIPTIGGDSVSLSVRFDDCKCGRIDDTRPAEITPVNSIRRTEYFHKPSSSEHALKPYYSQNDSIINYAVDGIFIPRDKIQLPPIRFGIEFGIDFYDIGLAKDYFIPRDTSWFGGTFIGDEEYSASTPPYYAVNVDYSLKKNSHLNVNVFYSAIDWMSHSTLEKTVVTMPCPTCPPETSTVLSNVNGETNATTIGFNVLYMYKTTRTLGPVFAAGLSVQSITNGRFIYTNGMDNSVIIERNSSTQTFGLTSSLGLEYAINSYWTLSGLYHSYMNNNFRYSDRAGLRISFRL